MGGKLARPLGYIGSAQVASALLSGPPRVGARRKRKSVMGEREGPKP